MFFFIAEYDPTSKVSAGGGIVDEGEDIAVLEIPFVDAYAMIETGSICDGKTIMLLQYAKLHIFVQ